MKFLLKVQNLVGFLMYLIFCGDEVETKAKIISSEQSLCFFCSEQSLGHVLHFPYLELRHLLHDRKTIARIRPLVQETTQHIMHGERQVNMRNAMLSIVLCVLWEKVQIKTKMMFST